jgi:hypothetical protein
MLHLTLKPTALKSRKTGFNTKDDRRISQWCRFLLEKGTGSQLVKKFLSFYGTLRFNAYEQVPANCPYSEPDPSSPCPHIPLSGNPS